MSDGEFKFVSGAMFIVAFLIIGFIFSKIVKFAMNKNLTGSSYYLGLAAAGYFAWRLLFAYSDYNAEATIEGNPKVEAFISAAIPIGITAFCEKKFGANETWNISIKQWLSRNDSKIKNVIDDLKQMEAMGEIKPFQKDALDKLSMKRVKEIFETEIKNMIKANPVPYYINGLATENENDFVYTPFENRYEISYLVMLEMERNRQNIKYYEEKDVDYREEVFGSMEAAVRVKVCK